MAYVYLLLCEDRSLYTGVAADLYRRMREHFHATRACAAYTRAHGARRLAQAWQAESLPLAQRAEVLIKRLSRGEKLTLIEDPARLDAALYPALGEAVYTPLSPSAPLWSQIEALYPEEKRTVL